MRTRTTNPRSVLVSIFHRDYVDDMDFDEKERTTVTDAEDALEKIECYLRAGWDDSATREINAFEESYGLSFDHLVSDVPGLADPR